MPEVVNKIFLFGTIQDNIEVSDKEIENYWINEINDPKLKIRKFSRYKIRRISQLKGVGKHLFGTGILTIYSTEFVQMIFGGIEYLKKMKH